MASRSLRQSSIKQSKSSNFFDQLETSKPSIPAEIFLVGGGAAGGGVPRSGGGGAGGILYKSINLTIGTTYTITVGAGGSGQTIGFGNNGSASKIVGGNIDFWAFGGGGGGTGFSDAASIGRPGGSGGGGTVIWLGSFPGQTADGGVSIEGQGNSGGSPYVIAEGLSGGGGGGAGGVGGNADNTRGGLGGVGTSAYSSWGLATSSGQNLGGTYWFAGGGGGGSYNFGGKAAGGSGGGGNGGSRDNGSSGSPTSGTANTGGGGGGSGNDDIGTTVTGQPGGSGIVIIRYLDTYNDPTSYTGSKYTSGGYRYYKFTGDGSITI